MIRKTVLINAVSALAITAILAGCSTLPRDGPTGRAVESGAMQAQAPYTIVDLTVAAAEMVKTLPPRFEGTLVAGVDGGEGRAAIGPGDVLGVSIFEAGGSLFGGGAAASGRTAAQTLPALTVDADGRVQIPFAGAISVAGLSTGEAGTAIRRALVGKVANPQVVVSVVENTYNTVTVLGEVRQPGRAPLSSNANQLIDVIAARGGVSKPTEDVLVVVQRNGQTLSAPLASVYSRFDENIRLQRGDQVNLVHRPRRFSTFGAMGAVSLVEMPAGPMSLTDAISRVGGLDTNSANARSVLVFRFERPEVAAALGVTQAVQPRGVPVVYRLNLEEAQGFFIANDFEIQPDDVLYVPRSGSAELGKFFTLVRTLSGVVYDISVTNTLNNN